MHGRRIIFLIQKEEILCELLFHRWSQKPSSESEVECFGDWEVALTLNLPFYDNIITAFRKLCKFSSWPHAHRMRRETAFNANSTPLCHSHFPEGTFCWGIRFVQIWKWSEWRVRLSPSVSVPFVSKCFRIRSYFHFILN